MYCKAIFFLSQWYDFWYSGSSLIIQQAEFTCLPLGKAFEKQIKKTKEHGKTKQKQLKIKKKTIPSFKRFTVFWGAITIHTKFHIKRRLNHFEKIIELKRTEEEQQKADSRKIFYKGYNKTDIF